MTGGLRSKVKGGIMPLVLGISLIMASICASLITYTSYTRLLARTMELSDVLERNCDSGIEYLLASADFSESYQKMELFGDGTDSIRVRRMMWGLLDALAVESHKGRHSRKKTVMAGVLVDSLHESSLYLTESTGPLYLAGDALLSGTVYLPESGVRPGNVGGNSPFSRSKLISGTKLQSEGMPALRSGMAARASTYLAIQKSLEQNWIVVNELTDSLVHSFSASKPMLYSSDKGILLNGHMVGMIMISSSTKITVSKEADLTHVVLIAPIIEIQKEFSGRLQAFASDVIKLDKNVSLLYPSTLTLDPKGDASKIELGAGARIQGDILIVRAPGNAKEGILIMHERSRLEGFAHIDGGAQILGTIAGHITCRKFFFDSGSEHLGNYIKDGEFSYKEKSVWHDGSGLWPGRGSVVVTELN